MYDWEGRLCSAATDRVVRPFDWGLDWTEGWPAAENYPRNGHTPADYLRKLSERALEASDDFFAYETPRDFRVDRLDVGGEAKPFLRFTSAVHTPYPENNLVHGQWFPAEEKAGRKKVACIVLPHWNASAGQHAGLCVGMAKFGISALRLSTPYHDYRMPAELKRADYAVSANVARTIDATRQGVIDTRSAVDWLLSQGYERIGVCGTSLGSCYAFLASTHDPRINVNVFNHCSTYFADVVWEGLSSAHIKESLQGALSLDELRDAWKVISPPYYIDRFARMKEKRSLFIVARYDTTFPWHFSEEVLKKAKELEINHKAVVLPCGHYTTGKTPFKFMDGYHIISFLKRNL